MPGITRNLLQKHKKPGLTFNGAEQAAEIISDFLW
jgi:hypothetical protein